MEDRGKDKTLAGILGIVVGGLGVHHFYLGSWGAGLILLGVSILTCGAAGFIVGLVEGIMILTMDDGAFNERYNLRQPEPVEFAFMKS